MRQAVPRIDEHGRFRRRAAHGMGHQPLQKAHTLVGDIKENDRRPKNAAAPDDLHIEDIGDPHQQEDQHFFCDTIKALLK